MLYRDQNDETLVMLTLAGEQRAYEVLVLRYESAVITAANSVLHSRYMAEDAAQDAFITAWMKLNILREPKKYGSWVCRIAKNCARNMAVRMRSYLSYDVLENVISEDEASGNPEMLYVSSEERKELHESISDLPEKVKQVIRLHYFEELSIVEIADRMRTSIGTVKSQLHDGRKRIRKELSAMNEKVNDTLLERVMKKVEEIKLWQIKNNKTGFEAVYNDVLRDVEELPESGDKYHALADVLMRGWWWLTGDKNDALFAWIKEAAIKGKNDEVMAFIVSREDSQVYGGAKIDFIRDKQIPMLEEAGFIKALAREWFWLGYQYFRNDLPDKGSEAYNKAQELLKPSDVYYALIPQAREMEEKLSADFKDKDEYRYLIGANAIELRNVDGSYRFWKDEAYGEGHLISVDRRINDILRNSSCCDGCFFDDSLKVGESIVGSDGTTLTFASNSETIETPCGIFEGCQLWVTTRWENYSGVVTCKSYYKSGVGIVKHEHIVEGLMDVRVLKSYQIVGGSGLLPLAIGNTWEYADKYDPSVMRSTLKFSVSHADENLVIIASSDSIERLKYDEDSWLDMIQQIRNEYCTHGNDQKICDVSHAIERAEALAKTPMEKAHTKAAVSVARRIMETDTTFNPNYTATGHWNFFSRDIVQRKKDALTIDHNFRWSFEWKNTGGMGEADTPLLYNDIYGILQNAANCIWSDEWKVGASPLVEYMLWGDNHIKTQIVCEDGGTITTKAGTFENCLKLSMDIQGLKDGLAYRGGHKEYYFANGIGIVRTVNDYCGGARNAVYELTSYEGTGEGYMPMADGMMRRYDALDLTDGFVGAAAYTYVEDDDGQMVIFADRTGIREVPPPITFYSAIQGEVIEEELWNAGKHEESRLRHAVNNLHLVQHFLGRASRYWAAPDKAVEWNKYRMSFIEMLSSNGEIPRAWLGLYSSTCFRTACALFGCGRKDEGYEYLERSFELIPKWLEIPDGELLEVGNDLIYGGVKFVKGKNMIVLPDGSKEPLYYDWIMECSNGLFHYGMTAPYGWEWFNSVRGEDRFKECVERAKKLTEAK